MPEEGARFPCLLRASTQRVNMKYAPTIKKARAIFAVFSRLRVIMPKGTPNRKNTKLENDMAIFL